MPQIVNSKWSIENGKQKPIHHLPFTIHHRLWRPGFTLIEILLALLIIIAMLAIFFTTSSTYVSSRSTNLQSIASKIASCEIEQLRKTDYSTLVNGTTNIQTPCDQDLPKLPQRQATRTLTDYSGNNKIKQAIILITWVDNSANKNIRMETLIYEFGL